MLYKIKSKYIINQVFENIRNKRKLNIIKYNKKITKILNVTKEDFEIYKILEEFNKKYRLKIDDIDIKELNINEKFIRNEGLEYLRKIGFSKLRDLNLRLNDISDISILELVNMKNLNKLDLSKKNLGYKYFRKGEF